MRPTSTTKNLDDQGVCIAVVGAVVWIEEGWQCSEGPRRCHLQINRTEDRSTGIRLR